MTFNNFWLVATVVKLLTTNCGISCLISKIGGWSPVPHLRTEAIFPKLLPLPSQASQAPRCSKQHPWRRRCGAGVALSTSEQRSKVLLVDDQRGGFTTKYIGHHHNPWWEILVTNHHKVTIEGFWTLLKWNVGIGQEVWYHVDPYTSYFNIVGTGMSATPTILIFQLQKNVSYQFGMWTRLLFWEKTTRWDSSPVNSHHRWGASPINLGSSPCLPGDLRHVGRKSTHLSKMWLENSHSQFNHQFNHLVVYIYIYRERERWIDKIR